VKYFKRSLYAVSIIISVLAINAPARADDIMLPDTFMLRLGGYVINGADTIARLDANNGPVGTYIDFHDTLGGETRATVLRLDGLYRFNDHHALGFSWYDVKFSGSRVLSQDITWNGVPYSANTQVNSQLKFDVYKLNYQYSLYHNEKVELGVLFGFHIMHIFAGINASSINVSEGDAITAPLPVWGMFADYKFTPRFSAFYNYQVFHIDYQDKVRGGLQDFIFGLEYRLFRNVAVGAAYNRYSLNLKAKGNDATLYVDSAWNGVMLYGAVYF
jgi:hypothetical protein